MARLRRIPVLEAGHLRRRPREQLSLNTVPHLLEAEVYLKYERQLKNLNLQENRIRRNQEKDLKRLQEIQSARREQEAIQRKLAEAKAKQPHPNNHRNPSRNPKLALNLKLPKSRPKRRSLPPPNLPSGFES